MVFEYGVDLFLYFNTCSQLINAALHNVKMLLKKLYQLFVVLIILQLKEGVLCFLKLLYSDIVRYNRTLFGLIWNMAPLFFTFLPDNFQNQIPAAAEDAMVNKHRIHLMDLFDVISAVWTQRSEKWFSCLSRACIK